MGKRTFSIVLALALVAGVFSALPANAQDAPPTVPAVVNIEDPKGDANYLNDQGLGLPLPGDNTTASAGTVSDILAAWFSSTPDTISAHILTDVAPPASTPLIFHVRVDPGAGSECLWFRASFNSVVQGQGDPVVPRVASLRDTCPTAKGIQPGELTVGTTAGSDGVITMTFPRSIHPAFVDGTVLKAPTADSRNYPAGQLTVPQIDDTKPGTDYIVGSGGGPVVEPAPEPSAEPEPKPEPKPTPKKCKKGQKKCKKPKPPVVPSCPPYVPGEKGAEAEITIVTDAATAEKPVELEFDAGRGLGGPLVGGVPVPPDQTKHNYHNVQIDSQAAEVGLYVRLEFPDRRDYDLYLLYPDGSEATHSGDFNSGTEIPQLSCGSAATSCQSGSNFESVNGIKTADCQGWTTDSVAYLTEGGKVKLKMWLGEIKADPAAPGGGEEEETLSTFFSLLGI